MTLVVAMFLVYLYDLFVGALIEAKDIIKFVKADLRVLNERDPTCISYVHCFLNFKDFLPCQAHRIANKLWSKGRANSCFIDTKYGI